jgi:tetratricopeptide (TPR) repeat protein
MSDNTKLENVRLQGEKLAAAVADAIDYLNDSREAIQYLSSGKIQEYRNSFVNAAIWYRRSVMSDDSCYEARVRLAIVLGKIGCSEESIDTINSLVEVAPNYEFQTLGGKPASVMTVLADALRAKGDQEGAKMAYKKATELCQSDTYAAAEYATILLEDGDYEGAKVFAERISDSPDRAALRAALRLATNPSAQLPTMIKESFAGITGIGLARHV